MRLARRYSAAAVLFVLAVAARPWAQTSTPRPPQGRGGGQSFPAQQRPPGDPAVIARGSGLYGVYCRACHGVDLRGGDQGGPNLLRSDTVLNDQAGELIAPIVLKGRQGVGIMPPTPVTPDDARAIAEYIHSVAATMRGQGNPPAGPPVVLNVLVGDPAAGQAYFNAKCATCHSATGDLRGIGGRMSDPTTLQNYWLSAGGGLNRGVRGQGCSRDGHRHSRTETRRHAGPHRRLLCRHRVARRIAADIPPRKARTRWSSCAIRWNLTANCCRPTPTRTFTT